MKGSSIQSFNVVGISVITTNENGQSSKDIPALWNKFMNEGILEKIPDKIGKEIYCVYTNYEDDYTKPYTTILGCRVSTIDNIPEGMTGKIIEAANYIMYIAKRNILKGTVFDTWTKIWNTGLQRTYTADFEVYGAKAQNPQNAEVDIFVAVK